MDNWVALLRQLPQDSEQLRPFLSGESNFVEFIHQEYPRLEETVRREIERNLATRKGLKFVDLTLQHKDPGVRRLGLELCSLLPAELRIPRLLKMLDNKDEGIKLVTAAKLGELRSLEVVNALIQGLVEGQWLPARVAQALSSMQDLSVPQLRGLLATENEQLRINVLEILAVINTDQARGLLIEALQDSSPVIRRSAVNAMEQFPLEISAPALLTALDQEQEISTKICLIRMITKLGIAEAKPRLLREEAVGDSKLAQTVRKALQTLP